MTTYTKKKEESPENDLLDFMAELDSELKPEAKAKQQKKPMAYIAPAVIQPQWFPFGVKFVLRKQTCSCGAEFQSVIGQFLIDMTKNGASRSIRHAGGQLPEPYRYYAAQYEEEAESIPSCPWCYKPEPKPAAPQVTLPAKPLTAEEIRLLKDLDTALEGVK